jgi:hypothetical protein
MTLHSSIGYTYRERKRAEPPGLRVNEIDLRRERSASYQTYKMNDGDEWENN